MGGSRAYNMRMKLVTTHRLIGLLALACLLLVGFLLFEQPVAAVIAKLLASTAFVGIAINVGALRSPYGRTLLIGLILSWLGDAFLIGESRIAFLSGLAAFLLAHVAYSAAFIRKGVEVRWVSIAALPVAAVAVGVSTWLAPHLPADLQVPVRLYTVVISLMLVAAIGTRGRGASWLILAGASLFFVSDLSVAALRLVQTGFPTYVWGLPFYYAGQACLALSTSQSRSH